MVIMKMKIGKREFYSVNGYHVRADAMNAIGEELFTPEGWAIIAKQIATLGYVNCNLHSIGIEPAPIRDALDIANKKIAELEKIVAKFLKGD